ncbi:hypothetical protein AB0912_15595 [Streptomyces sp. NPDC007084]|uniref:hypothetical protein n=1 Tax=Streptomyces sp. NPDC007084 TaxID=3154313 RepID=UPI0034535B50
MADHDEQRAQAIKALLGAFNALRIVLQSLPIPVEIPSFFGTDGRPSPEGVLALDRARAILADEPIAENVRNAHDSAILDWFTTYELMFLTAMAGPAPWRMDAAEYSLARLATILEMITTDDLDDWDDKS